MARLRDLPPSFFGDLGWPGSGLSVTSGVDVFDDDVFDAARRDLAVSDIARHRLCERVQNLSILKINNKQLFQFLVHFFFFLVLSFKKINSKCRFRWGPSWRSCRCCCRCCCWSLRSCCCCLSIKLIHFKALDRVWCYFVQQQWLLFNLASVRRSFAQGWLGGRNVRLVNKSRLRRELSPWQRRLQPPPPRHLPCKSKYKNWNVGRWLFEPTRNTEDL